MVSEITSQDAPATKENAPVVDELPGDVVSKIARDIEMVAAAAVQSVAQEEEVQLSQTLHRRHPKGIRARATAHAAYRQGIDTGIKTFQDVVSPLVRVALGTWLIRFKRKVYVASFLCLALGYGVGRYL